MKLWLKSALLLAILVAVARIAFYSDRALRLRIAIEMFGWGGVANIAKASMQEKLFGPKGTESRLAFRRLLHTLQDVEEKYIGPGRGITEENEMAEGDIFLSHVLRTALETFLEVDHLRPTFTSLVRPTLKVLGDNPDAFYLSVPINHGVVYMIKGLILLDKHEVYTSFTFSEASCSGCFLSRVVADINSFDLNVTEHGEYAIYISTKPMDALELAAGENLIQLTPTDETHTLQLITRHYFEREVSVHLDPTIFPKISIEIHTNYGNIPATRFPFGDAEVAKRLDSVSTFLRQHTIEMSADPATAPSWFSFVPNKLGKPMSFRTEGANNSSAGGGFGAVDMTYSAGLFVLEPGTGLLLEGEFPQCVFASVQIWNRYLQTFDYRAGSTSLNRKQMKTLSNSKKLTGSWRVIISPTKPPKRFNADWLDSLGRLKGQVFIRVLLAKEAMKPIETSLVRL